MYVIFRSNSKFGQKSTRTTELYDTNTHTNKNPLVLYTEKVNKLYIGTVTKLLRMCV